MLPTRAIDLENFVASDGQPLKIIEAGTSPFYALDHPHGELRRGVAAFRSADPDGDPLVTIDKLRNIGARQLNISAVKPPDLSQSLGAFNSADEFQRSQPFRHTRLLSGGQDVLPKAEPYGSQQYCNDE